MISDQLRAAPEPVPVAASDLRFPGWDDRGARPYGALTDTDLAVKAAELTRRAAAADQRASEQARASDDGAVELAQHPGRQIADSVSGLIDTADRLIRQARHDTDEAERARVAAAGARDVCASLQRATGRSRIALRLAGTSRTEQQQLIAQYTQQAEAADREHELSTRSAAEARREAARILESSPYTKALRDQAAGGMSSAVVRLEELEMMRQQLPVLALRIDNDRAGAVRAARAAAVDLRARAETLRTDAGGMQAERELRRRIAEQEPVQHRAEAHLRDQFTVHRQAQLAAQRAHTVRPSRRDALPRTPGGPSVSV